MNSYSQCGQDHWVYTELKTTNGTFLDIGCGHPTDISNTKALEELGWTGWRVDVCEQSSEGRTSPFIRGDATNMKWDFLPRLTIDYLSLDVDACSLDALRNLLTTKIRFRRITAEHDSYRFGHEMRDKMRELLLNEGYTLIRPDVCNTPGMPFEDWWIFDDTLATLKGVKEPLIKPKPTHSTLNDYFDKIIIINRDSRTDRWEQCVPQLAKHKIIAERFSAIDQCVIDGWTGGHGGCTSSHRCILDTIIFMKWQRTLILEDDFLIRHEDMNERFASMVGEVPADWQMLYLGGHYAEKPQYAVSEHVIRMGLMMTTSSYAVTYKFAREVAPNIFGGAAIDNLYYKYHLERPCYIFRPRLMIQAPSFSDLQGIQSNHGPCMEDTRHERMV